MASALNQRQPKKEKPSPNIWHGDTDISDDVAQHKAQVLRPFICLLAFESKGISNEVQPMNHWRLQKHTWPMFFSLSYRCIGVIYGDLTTSPL